MAGVFGDTRRAIRSVSVDFSTRSPAWDPPLCHTYGHVRVIRGVANGARDLHALLMFRHAPHIAAADRCPSYLDVSVHLLKNVRPLYSKPMKFSTPLVIAIALNTTLASATLVAARPYRGVDQSAPATRNLTTTEMETIQGSGSTCRLGCNEPDVACSLDATMTQVWYPHLECGYAPGTDTCTTLPDVMCNKRRFFLDYPCDREYTSDTTWTSTCTIPPTPPTDPGL